MPTFRPLDYLAYLAVRVVFCIIQAMPADVAHSVCAALAFVMADVLRARHRVVDENLVHAFPRMTDRQRRRVVRRMWEHLFLMAVEIAHTPRKIHHSNWRDYVRLIDKDVLVRLLVSDRPTIIVTGHFGNFEVAGVLLGILGFPTHTIARKLDNPFLDRFINAFRGRTGQHIIPKKGGYDRILDVLDGGGVLTFLADQYGGDKGCWIEFFGRPASAHKAIALLSLDNDAPLVVSYARRREGPDGFRPMQFEMSAVDVIDPRTAGDEVASIKALTQAYSTRMEEFITRWPDQYWWLHRRWKDTRKRRKEKRQQTRAAA